MSEVASSPSHPSLIKKFNMSLKIDTGVVIDESDVPEESYDANATLPSNAFATPKGPLPTLLFARKHSMNVPRSVVRSAEEEERKKVESMVTQVKKCGPSTPSNRPRTPSGRIAQDTNTTTAVASPKAAVSPKASPSSDSEKGVFNKFFGWSSSKPSSPVAPPSPSACMSPTAGKAKEIKKIVKQGLLGEQGADCTGRKCLVLDLDETLVHSSFRPTKKADFVIPVEIDGTTHQVYVGKRPFVDEFLARMGKIYEIVIFTASLPKYANPLLDVLDKSHNVIKWRLYREHCTYHDGCYVKDLSRLGRPMNEVLIVDNAPYSYKFQPENGIASDTWNDDPHCNELQTMADYLESIASEDDLRMYTDQWNNCSERQNSVNDY